MASDFDMFPVYDKVADKDGTLSPLWQDFMATFFQNLIGYLTQAGMLLPQMTTVQRDSFLNPQFGQIIYNTTDNTAQYYKNVGGITPTWVNI